MQVSPVVPSATSAAAPVLRVLAGDVTALPVGELLKATVTASTVGRATISVNGATVTVRTDGRRPTGPLTLLRVPAGLEVVIDGRAAGVSRPVAGPAGLEVVIDGRAAGVSRPVSGPVEDLVGTTGPLVGTTGPLTRAARLEPSPTDVATAILKATPAPPDLGESLAPLLAELSGRPDAKEALAAVRSFLPDSPRPLDARQLQSLVENGGLAHEAKLARGDIGTAPDLKSGLLRLLQATADLGRELPTAKAVLDGIEVRQAANVLAADHRQPYLLQVPFPDGDHWKTLNLAVEPDDSPTPDRPRVRGFRLLMRIELSELGEAWIDAGTAGGGLRAVLYLTDATARDRVRGELSDLRRELLGEGFSEVLLDVRPAGELPANRRAVAAAVRAGRGVSVVDAEV